MCSACAEMTKNLEGWDQGEEPRHFFFLKWSEPRRLIMSTLSMDSVTFIYLGGLGSMSISWVDPRSRMERSNDESINLIFQKWARSSVRTYMPTYGTVCTSAEQ
jgi:hypothetical protein